MLIRREFLRAAMVALAERAVGSRGADKKAASPFDANLIQAPEDPRRWPAFRDDLTRWREDKRVALNYDDRLYRRPDLKWAASSFACCFLMLYDEEFYSREQGRYLVEEWLDNGSREFGGYDSLVLWHAYPRIGVDPRNQFDFYRDMPGGLSMVKRLIERLHHRHVKAYIDYNPWDRDTRREEKSDVDALADLVGEIGADGIFLDTMDRGAREFRSRLDGARRGVVLEGENALPLENIHDHHLSWAQWFRDSRVPGILRNKWFERRHMQHQIRRWDHDHTGELHTAWMNGSGVMVWENVFGSWVGWNPRDRSMLRAILPIQRYYAGLFAGDGWTPLVETRNDGLFASLWEGGGMRLWTLVNRTEEPAEGPLLSVPEKHDQAYFDLVSGRELKPARQGGQVVLEGEISPRGIGCLVARPAGLRQNGWSAFLNAQAANHAKTDLAVAFPARRTVLRSPPQTAASPRVPDGMVAIGPLDYDMESSYQVRECGQLTSLDYKPGLGFERMHQQTRIRRHIQLQRYALDIVPVTNAEYARFLQASGYRPRQAKNFLKHWKKGALPAGKEHHPVVYVDLDDARAYARWAGKRLPTEAEWQYAAEGPSRLVYPWGNEMKPGACNIGESGGTTEVHAFSAGRSPFGCEDMCGNTWEWTESENSDGRTRFALLRGGSYFKAKGSVWYADGGPRPCQFGMKFLLMWPGLDRCSTVGFRCAVSLSRSQA